jgi:Tol biopolymer transport system component
MCKKFAFIPLFVGAVTLLAALTTFAQDATPIPPVTPAINVAFPELATTITATVATGGPRLRVRAEPSLSAPITARLIDDSVVNVVGRNASNSWVLVPLVDADAFYGWASASYLRLNAPIASLPVLAESPVIPFDSIISEMGKIEGATSVTATVAPTFTASAVASTTVTPTVTSVVTLSATPGESPTVLVMQTPAPTAIAPLPTVPGSMPATPPPPPFASGAPFPVPASAPSQPSGLYGKIAVPVFDEQRKTYNVWLVNADGSDLHWVVEQASSPTLSRDGAMLAYRRWKVDDRGIVVANADGSNPLRITEKLEDVLPSFSPDRTKVAFSTYRWGDRKNRLYYAWSDEQNKVAWEWGNGGIFGEDPYWASDGRIFFRVTRPEHGVEELWSMDGRTGETRTLLYVTSSIRSPALSPDLRTVVYMAYVEGSWELYTLDLFDRTVTRLTDNGAEDGLPTFSPNGEYIAFVSDRGGAWGLWRMTAAGDDVRQITALPGSVDGRVEFEPDYLNHGWLEEQISWSW